MAVNDRAIITPDLMAHIHFCAPLGLVYMMNPKAACSTIKQSLWKRCDTINDTATYPGHPHHDRNRAPFNYAIYPADILPAHAADFHRAMIFTTVRNPYARMLSAYLEKIWDTDRDKDVWPV